MTGRGAARRRRAAFLLAGLALGCRAGEPGERRAAALEVRLDAGPGEELAIEPTTAGDSVIVEQTWDYVDAVDHWLDERPEDERLFARLGDRRWIEVADPAAWPEGTLTGAGVLLDGAGRVRQVFTAPVPAAADGGFEIFTHVFDDAGRTVFFERATSFTAPCLPGRAHETATTIFNAAFTVIARSYDLVDDEDRTIDPVPCGGSLGHRHDYRVEPTADALLRSTGLDTAVASRPDPVPVIS